MEWIWSVINVLGLSWLFVCIVVFLGKKISSYISFRNEIEHRLKKSIYIDTKINEFDRRINHLEKQLKEEANE